MSWIYQTVLPNGDSKVGKATDLKRAFAPGTYFSAPVKIAGAWPIPRSDLAPIELEIHRLLHGDGFSRKRGAEVVQGDWEEIWQRIEEFINSRYAGSGHLAEDISETLFPPEKCMWGALCEDHRSKQELVRRERALSKAVLRYGAAGEAYDKANGAFREARLASAAKRKDQAKYDFACACMTALISATSSYSRAAKQKAKAEKNVEALQDLVLSESEPLHHFLKDAGMPDGVERMNRGITFLNLDPHEDCMI